MAAIVRKMATHVDPSGPGDLHQMDVISHEESTVCRAIKSHRTVNALRRNGSHSDLHRTADAARNLFPLDRAIVAIRAPEASSDGADRSWKNSAIAARSNRDQRVDVE